MTYYEVIKKALYMFYHRDEYAYFYGAKGQVLTDEVMNTLISLEPAYFQSIQHRNLQLIKLSRVVKSDLIVAASYLPLWVCKITALDTIMMGQKNNTAFRHRRKRVVFIFGGKGRHVGIDIGYGFFLHMPKRDTQLN